MRKFCVLFILLISVLFVDAKKRVEVNVGDEIAFSLKEAMILYFYETTAWHGSDNAAEAIGTIEDVADYIVYEKEDSIFMILFYDVKESECVLSQVFDFKMAQVGDLDTLRRPLTDNEKNLITMRGKLYQQIDENNKDEYKIAEYENSSLNNVLIPIESGYKLYLMRGTPQKNVIPFGGDYLFVADGNGDITGWKKFHTGLIPAFTEVDGNPIDDTSLIHSHVIYPFMSPTEICTFMLYGPMYGLNEFSVFAVRLGLKFTYKIDEHNITTSKM